MAPASKRLREEPVYAPAQRKGCHDGFVYIMYEREFLARGDELYKVGMSELGEETRRMQHGYTGGSQLIACAAVSNARVVETRIKERCNALWRRASPSPRPLPASRRRAKLC